MIEENDKYIEEIERLLKLKKLVSTEKQFAEYNDESDDMTITDLEEWLAEIDLELSSFKK